MFQMALLLLKEINCAQGEQLCQIILKSMHKCRSYGPDKSGPTHALPTRDARTHTEMKELKLLQLCLPRRKWARQKLYKFCNNSVPPSFPITYGVRDVSASRDAVSVNGGSHDVAELQYTRCYVLPVSDYIML